MTWKPLDPYAVGTGEETQPLEGEELAELVAHYKRTADQHGLPHDPEWDRWLLPPVRGAAGFAEARRRFG